MSEGELQTQMEALQAQSTDLQNQIKTLQAELKTRTSSRVSALIPSLKEFTMEELVALGKLTQSIRLAKFKEKISGMTCEELQSIKDEDFSTEERSIYTWRFMEAATPSMK
ncbi:hypothetical protein NDI52_19465 [Leptolyngbya sp. PL-A3]|nr:hypothetical protein [Leptolyngbya sp. FACHB-16]